jgi:hypothetical protein
MHLNPNALHDSEIEALCRLEEEALTELRDHKMSGNISRRQRGW